MTMPENMLSPRASNQKTISHQDATQFKPITLRVPAMENKCWTFKELISKTHDSERHF